MRQIRIMSTQTGTVKTISSDAVTWGELKQNSDIRNSMGTSTQAIVRETKNTLEHDDAVLPEGDFTIFFVPTKTKSGGITPEEVTEIIEDKVEDAKQAIEEKILALETELYETLDSMRKSMIRTISPEKRVEIQSNPEYLKLLEEGKAVAEEMRKYYSTL